MQRILYSGPLYYVKRIYFQVGPLLSTGTLEWTKRRLNTSCTCLACQLFVLEPIRDAYREVRPYVIFSLSPLVGWSKYRDVSRVSLFITQDLPLVPWRTLVPKVAIGAYLMLLLCASLWLSYGTTPNEAMRAISMYVTGSCESAEAAVSS